MPTVFHRPTTFEEAAALCADNSAHSVAIRGGALAFAGHDLPYDRVIDLSAVPGLDPLERTETGLIVGPNVLLRELAAFPGTPDLVRDAITRCIPPNLCNNTSIGEALTLPEHPLLRELHTALALLGVSGDGLAARQIALDPAARYGSAFVSRTPTDYALVCAAAAVTLDGDIVSAARVAIGGMGTPTSPIITLSTLVNQPFDAPNIASAVKLVAAEVTAVTDAEASADYRRALALVCARRALHTCLSSPPG